MEKLNLSGDALRGRVRIQYVDHFGEVEAGVDGGGLFKDFMENLVKEGFDPQVGLGRVSWRTWSGRGSTRRWGLVVGFHGEPGQGGVRPAGGAL